MTASSALNLDSRRKSPVSTRILGLQLSPVQRGTWLKSQGSVPGSVIHWLIGFRNLHHLWADSLPLWEQAEVDGLKGLALVLSQ